MKLNLDVSGFCSWRRELRRRFFSSVIFGAGWALTTSFSVGAAEASAWGYVQSFPNGETALVFTNTAAKIIRWTVPNGVTKIDALVVAGGGGGGYGGANEKGSAVNVGGGGGGFVLVRSLSVRAGFEVSAVVGVGGAGGTYETFDGECGGDSQLVCGEETLVSRGGGFGGGSCLGMARAGGAGGCGGGSALMGDGGGECLQGEQGWGWQASMSTGGAGGGAGERALGNKRNTYKRSQGGAGITNAILGVDVEYGRGGDGTIANVPAADGRNGTGGGGAGGCIMMGGRGGDGIVVVRFAAPAGYSQPQAEFDSTPFGGRPMALSPQDGERVSLLTGLQKSFFALPTLERQQLLSETDTAYRRALCADLVDSSVPPCLRWTGTVGPCTVTVRDANDGSVCFACETSSSFVKVNTLHAGATYRWSVTSADGQTAEATFSVESDAPHLIVGDWGALNARDLGGWKGLDGRRVRQGVAWRMTRFNQTLGADVTELDPGRCFFWTNTVGIRTEIDLRDTNLGKSILGPNVDYRYCKIGVYSMTETDHRNHIAAFRVFLDPANYPIAFHCSGGRDRTGTLAYLLNGLLGVSDDDLERDFEATWLRLPEESLNDNRFGGRSLANVLTVIDGYAGATRAEKIAAYFKAGGVTDEEIATFRRNLLEPISGGSDEPGEPPDEPDEPPDEPDDPPDEPDDPPVVVGAEWGYELSLAGGDIVRVYTNTAGTIEWKVPSGVTSVRYFVVGGGGGGGPAAGGGGGGGAFKTAEASVTPAMSCSILVGAGGAKKTCTGTADADNGNPGSPSVLTFGDTTVTANGGGGGGGFQKPGSDFGVGASGGGQGGRCGGTRIEPVADAAGTIGHAGGTTQNKTSDKAGAGGGGAGGEGTSGVLSNFGQNGGDGLCSDITGEPVYYAAGGGGGTNAKDRGAASSLGGSNGAGGRGGDQMLVAESGTTFGSGGGGGGWGTAGDVSGTYFGAAGANGVVILRYTPTGGGEEIANPAFIGGGDADNAALARVKAWAAANGVTVAQINAMKFKQQDGTGFWVPTDHVAEKFLLNLPPNATAEELAAEKAAFRFTAITPGEEPTVFAPARGYNGEVKILTSAAVDGTYEIDAAAADGQLFYKAVLVR